MSLKKYVVYSIVCAASITSGSVVRSDIHAQPSINQVVRGGWFLRQGEPVELFDDQLAIDLNDDSTNDLHIFHGFAHSTLPVTADVLPYVQTATTALHEMQLLLNSARNIALDAANSGVNDIDALYLQQIELNQILAAMDQIATGTAYNNQRLLDGSAGLSAIVPTTDFRILNVGRDTVAGPHHVMVNTPAMRPFVEAKFVQSGRLDQDEVLTVNDVSIALYAGFTQQQVVAQVNAETRETGVFAQVNRTSGLTQLISLFGGFGSEIQVISSRHPTDLSSGFNNQLATNNGADAMIEIDGHIGISTGEQAYFPSGPTSGLTIALNYLDDNDYVNTVFGSLGDFTIVDNSLRFSYPSGAPGRVVFPNVTTAALGTFAFYNQFSSLSEITVTSARKAQDAVGVIDHAFDQLNAEITHLAGLEIGVPESRNRISGDDTVRFLTDGVVPAGTLVGAESSFTDTYLSVPSQTDGYIGLQLATDDGMHYGWLHVATDFDKGWVVRSAALEREPGRSIRTGVVPEPIVPIRLFFGLVGIGLARLHNRQIR